MSQKPVRVERIVRRHFGGSDENKGVAETLRHLEHGAGIRFLPSGPTSWRHEIKEPNQSTLALCDFSAMALRDKRLDLIVSVDAGGNTRLLAETLALRTRRLCHHFIGNYSVSFAVIPGQKRMQRAISYDGDPRSVIRGKRIFLYGDVLEQNCYLLRLAKEIATFGRRMAAQGNPELAPVIVGIGAPVIRDFGIRKHIVELVGYEPELHYLVHARRKARQTSMREANMLALNEIRHEKRSTASVATAR